VYTRRLLQHVYRNLFFVLFSLSDETSPTTVVSHLQLRGIYLLPVPSTGVAYLKKQTQLRFVKALPKNSTGPTNISNLNQTTFSVSSTSGFFAARRFRRRVGVGTCRAKWTLSSARTRVKCKAWRVCTLSTWRPRRTGLLHRWYPVSSTKCSIIFLAN